MDAVRARFGALEWLVAAAVLFAALAAGSVIVRDLRAVTPPDRDAHPTVSALLPTSVPGRAISVPMLLLQDDKEVRLGDTEASVAALLGRSAETGIEYVDRTSAGDRITRFYEHLGRRFVLVFEPSQSSGDARVGAIYVQ